MMPEEWDAVLAKRISRACDEAEHPRGMSPHDGKVHLDASVVRRLLSAALRERENAKDAARLDWLESHPREGTIRIGTDMKPCIFWGMSSAPGFTLRAAIDAAMRGEEGAA